MVDQAHPRASRTKDRVSAPAGATVLAAYVLALVSAGVVLVARRDVT